jgi:hypothetical protein
MLVEQVNRAVQQVFAAITVTSVAGQTGDVTLTKADVGLGNADNTADANKALGAAATVSDSGTIATNSVGFRGIPQEAKSAGYTLALTDNGKHISISSGNVTIPASASIAFPIGATIAIYNNSASTRTIGITTDTLRLAGTATTGTRTLAARGLATLLKVGAAEWVATGSVT